METYQDKFNINFNYFLKDYISCNKTIQEKVKYMTSDGKRLRGILGYAFGCININDKYDYGCEKLCICHLIELIHCLSLVLDDTPIMDNDETRRGKLSFYSKYGINYTYNFFYYILSKITIIFNKTNHKYYDILHQDKSNFILFNNMQNMFADILKMLINGQYLDINYENISNILDNSNDEIKKSNNEIKKSNTEIKKINNTINIEQIYQNILYFCEINQNNDKYNDNDKYKYAFENYKLINNIEINIKKTSSLFILSSIIPLFYTILDLKIKNTQNIQNTKKKSDFDFDFDFNFEEKYIEDILNNIIIWSTIFGIIFQYTDDLLDIEQDKINKKPNICFIIDKSRAIVCVSNGISWLRNNIKIIQKKYKDIFMLDMDIEIINIILDKLYSRINKVK